jgi:acyl phosphate:glycerol-3-phosphate acyltransferase
MSPFFSQFLFLITTYLICSIPFGLIISKIFGDKDIREHGSGNIGATNVARILGKKLGLATLILDGLKGAIMVVVARFVYGDVSGLSIYLVMVAAIAVVGHVYPIYLKFKGGKGVATTFAVLFVINPMIGLVNALTWLAVFMITRTSAISSLIAIVTTAIFSLWSSASIEEVILCIFLTILIFIRHKDNIVRLRQGKENKFESKPD